MLFICSFLLAVFIFCLRETSCHVSSVMEKLQDGNSTATYAPDLQMVNKQHMYSSLNKAKIKDQNIIITHKDYLNNRVPVPVNSAVGFRCTAKTAVVVNRGRQWSGVCEVTTMVGWCI